MSSVHAALKKGWAGLAVLTFVLAVVWNGYYTARQFLKDLTHLADPEDTKIARDLGGADGVHAILDVKQKIPDDAIIGFPRSGQFSTLHWSLLYPRRVVVVDSLAEFERKQPTHILIGGGYPPYTFPGDPRPPRWTPPPEKFWIIQVRQVRPLEPTPRPTMPHGWARLPATLIEGLAPWVIGAAFLLIIGHRGREWGMGWPAYLAMAFLLGIGIHTLLLFCLSLARIPLTSWSIATIDGLLVVVALTALFRFRTALPSMRPRPPLERFETCHWVVVTLLGLLLLVHLIVNLFWPITYIDAVGSYDYRAKAIVQQGTVVLWQFFNGAGWVNFYYPFFQTMLHAHHYLLGGSHARVYGTLMLGAFLVLFYAVLKGRSISSFQSLVFTAVLGGSFNVVALSGHVVTLNFPQMVYSSLGLFFLLDYLQRREVTDLILSSLLLGFAGWVRTDSFIMLAVACLVVLLGGRLPLRARLLELTVLVGCYGLITLPHEYFMRAVVHYDVAASQKVSIVGLLDLKKILGVLAFFVEDSLHFEIGNLFLPWLLVVLADWSWRGGSRPWLLTTGLMIVGWVGLFAVVDSVNRDELMRMGAVRWYINLLPFYVASITQTDLMRRVFDVLEGRVPLRLRLGLF